MWTPELLQKAREARKSATPKATYAAAIQDHCEECCGYSPARSDCGGAELIDLTACRLYHINTAAKRRKVTKTTLKRAIKQECHFCLGPKNPLTDCMSPRCALYPLVPGPLIEAKKRRAAENLGVPFFRSRTDEDPAQPSINFGETFSPVSG